MSKEPPQPEDHDDIFRAWERCVSASASPNKYRKPGAISSGRADDRRTGRVSARGRFRPGARRSSSGGSRWTSN
jgi:hypothetical protein